MDVEISAPIRVAGISRGITAPIHAIGRVYALEKFDLTGDFARPMDPQPSTQTPDAGRQRVFVGGPSWVWIMARRSTDGRMVPMR
jgi:hypothetical protein